MVYKWKIPSLHKVSAQIAGEELERISKTGELTPKRVVDGNRKKTAPLYDCFDWNDKTAAESYREQQASEIIRSIVTVEVNNKSIEKPVRAFVSVLGSYKPLDEVIQIKEYKEDLIKSALKDMEKFQQKYSTLVQLADVFTLFEDVKKTLAREQNSSTQTEQVQLTA